MGKPSNVGAGGIEVGRTSRAVPAWLQDGQGRGTGSPSTVLSGEVKLARVASKPSEILQVINGQLKAADSDIYKRFDKILGWSDKFPPHGHPRQCRPAGPGRDCLRVRSRGIGLCRTEHMFFGEGRIPSFSE
jgi:pyruvate,orthophosphate dikinase